MAKYLVEVSVRFTNTYEVETDDYKGEPDRIAESQLRQDFESDLASLPKRINIVENMSVDFAGQTIHPTGPRWEVESTDVDDVSLMDH